MKTGKCRLLLILILLLILAVFSANSLAINLKLGDKGEEVFKVQSYLHELGYDLEVDGVFGFQTREVVKDFQLNNGLEVDGIIGEKTISLLEEMTQDIKYVVVKGDNLSSISQRFGTTVKAIKERNNLSSDLITIGQVLYIPKTGLGGGEEKTLFATIQHEVQPGDALSLIAKRYGVDLETIKLANNLSSDKIIIGQTLFIPRDQRDEDQPFKLVKGAFIWPVLGRISSGYGYRLHPIKKVREFHGGIDIAVPLGTEIRAAASGTVKLSGWVNGFGKTVIIDHGDDIRTLYGHNSRLLVKVGQQVKLGQVIALAGSTGLSTGSHLDFRIYQDGQTVNPLDYLP